MYLNFACLYALFSGKSHGIFLSTKSEKKIEKKIRLNTYISNQLGLPDDFF